MRKISIALVALLLLAACGKKEVKEVTPDSRLAAEAFALAETVRDAFVRRDAIALQQHATEEGLRAIMANSKTFDSVSLAFTPRSMEIDKEQVYLSITWKSTWTVSGRSVADRGTATFVMDGRPLKVSRILKGNPFVMPESS